MGVEILEGGLGRCWKMVWFLERCGGGICGERNGLSDILEVVVI